MKVCSKLIAKCTWGGKREGRISEERASVEGKELPGKWPKKKHNILLVAHLIK